MRRNYSKSISLFLAIALMAFMVFPTSLLAASKKPGIATWENEQIVHIKGYNVKAGKPVKDLPYGLQKKEYQNGETGPFIIVFGGPIEEPMKTGVEKVGADLVEYLPDFSFLATMTPEVAEKVKALPYITDVMVYQPAYKMSPSLSTVGNDDVLVYVSTFGADTSVLNNEIMNARATAVANGKGKAAIKMNRGQLIKFANSNAVKWIEEVPEYKLNNDIAKGYMGVDDLWNLGYDGSGQVVGIADTGLDTGVNNSTMHLDFQGRIDAIYALGRTTADDPHGHGTHVAGSVLGDGARSNGQIKGMAPAARLVFQSVLDSSGGLGGLPANLNDLFSQSKAAGSVIHTNSWGASVNGVYNTNAQEVDEYNWNNRDFIILFAASNDGPNLDTLGSPGTAKNCITVGASENYRPSKGSYADDVTDIAEFSSRGWTDDGRVKPDIVAPGTWILSTRSTKAADSSFWGNYDTYYAYMGGTSMATPLTAGAVAVAREFMQTEWGITPMASLMKAALINGATDLGLGIPSQHQGWGRIDLDSSLNNKEYKYVNESTALATSQKATYNYTVASSYTPLKITVAWTDYPGSTTASKTLVNDLDLKVTSPSGTVYYGNDFTSPYNSGYDRTNNVENVFINSPETGTYTVEVIGYNVPQGPQSFGLFASADFGTAVVDTQAPTVSITAPASGATVSGSTTYSATASDNIGVSRVDFYVGSTKVGTDSTSPYSISWDTTQQTNGSYSLVAKAYDANGNEGVSASRSVTVSNTVSSSNVTTAFTGSVSSTGTKDQYFYVDVTSTGTVSLDLSWSGTADLDMFLYNPSGTEVARAYTTSNPETISFNATTTGRYKIKVNAYSGSASYNLSATHPINSAVTSVGSASDLVDKNGTSTKSYNVTVGASGTINVSLTWDSTADLDVYLYNPSGTEVAKAYTTMKPESISYPVSTTGTYTIKVVAYSGSGNFDLDVVFPK